MHNRPGAWVGRPAVLMLLLLFIVSVTACESKTPPKNQSAKDGREIKYAPETKRVSQLNLKLPDEPAAINVPALLREKRCHLCHEESRQGLGPAYQAISLAHRSRREIMLEVLAQKIVRGGSGNWGVIPMVANRHVNLEEARLMAGWILDPK